MEEISMCLPISSEVSLINDGENCLSGMDFYVPAYQRPYSWGEDQIDDFLKTITDGFIEDKPAFFGTMQFDVVSSELYVVDGQQRLTTMKLFMYVLSGLSGKISFNFRIKYNNMKDADGLIGTLLTKDINSVPETTKTKQGKVDINNINSIFEANIRMLKEKLLKYAQDDGRSQDKYASDLINYFGKKVYVVVLKTKGLSLPEVINIFNTINTTGMDLNSEDIFKFQYYNYLQANDKQSTTPHNADYWMEQINDCYNRVEDYNVGKPIKDHISMSDILSVYQHCLCAKYETNYKILAKSTERFFTDLFVDPSKYSDLLKFEEFNRLVNEYINFYDELQENKYSVNKWHALSIELIKKTRYPRYWTTPYVYSFFKGNDEKTKAEALKIGYVLFSYLIVPSINYAKAITPVHTFVCNEILPAIAKNNDVISKIKPVQWSNPYKPTNTEAKTSFNERLQKNFYDNSKSGLICLLLALRVEDNVSLKNIKERFFNWEIHPYDIEHIYSKDSFLNDTSFTDDDKEFFNGIGNLIVLDREINRDMGRHQILLPADKYKHHQKYYDKSTYKIVRDFTPDLKDWNIDKVKKRCKDLLPIISDELLIIE